MQESEFDWTEGERGSFSWLDYVVFGGMLVLSLAIGIFYAFRSRKKSNDEFLLGSRSLSCFPVSMSLLASYISAIIVLGGPAEAYYHSVQWWVVCLSQVALPVVAGVFMPVFYELRLTSIYEYLELRYSSRAVRCVAGGMFVIQMLLYQAVVIYAPALALASVSDYPLWASVVSVGLIASFYTAIGGLKAVIWTDVLQLFILIAGLICIILKGTFDVGGFSYIWDTAVRNGRAGSQIFTYGYHPTQRHTVANIVIGAFVSKLYGYACAQTAVQRYSSMKSLTHAHLSIYLLIPFYTLIVSLTMIAGLVMFATYEGCDPLAAGLITKKDQILPFYVMDRLSSIPGLPGLFVACIFSGSLSTISSGVNSQAAVTWEDVFSRRPGCASLSKTTQAWITNTCLALGITWAASFKEPSPSPPVSGAILAVFVMGLFLPFANSKGAMAALIIGTIISQVFGLGPIILDMNPELLPTSTDLCPANLTLPTTSGTPISVSELPYPQKLLGLSYTQIAPLGFVVAFAVGIFTSFITGGSKGLQVERRLVHPWVRWSLPDPNKISAKSRLIPMTN
ncbi:Sodium-coupled monocarboxylate transporter 2 [Penaeus vannamei]|uniref:Sodium-coupled monocarboxylate transporter 2 n=1 Tax=Penaeus vannamei TaxID=6689 RepID=A0A423TUD4_PENVA|nr:Sodium-coupled monocarboxylate transporter 2 [Penaeus vannamei]